MRESEIGVVAGVIGALHWAAWRGSWGAALAELATALEADEVRVLARCGRRWQVLMSSAEPGIQEPLGARWAGNDVRILTQPATSGNPAVRQVIEAQLSRVLLLAQQRERELSRELVIRSALDRLEVGVVLFGDDGKVAQINRAAAEIISREPRLRAEVGEALVASEPELQRELARMVARIVGVSHDPAMRASEHVELSRPGAQPLRLLFVPLQGEGRSAGRSCALFLGDRELGVDLPEEVLQRHYGLTGAESRAVARLLRGLDIDGVAEELRVTRETVRSHLKRVYAKVGTTRQSELVGLILRGPAGLRWD